MTLIKDGGVDRAEIARLYGAAFPAEELFPLVARLLDLPAGVLSLTARQDGGLAGHVIFTLCAIDGQTDTAALLGPLAVEPAVQRSGIGSALVREGLARMAALGARHVLVLGDPAYYGRFGFAEESGISPPYAIPPEWKPAWQGLTLSKASPTLAGRLAPPAVWMEERYWLP